MKVVMVDAVVRVLVLVMVVMAETEPVDVIVTMPVVWVGVGEVGTPVLRLAEWVGRAVPVDIGGRPELDEEIPVPWGLEYMLEDETPVP